VSQSQRLRLAYVHDGHARRTDCLYLSQQLTFDALLKQRFQFIGGIEMVFHGILRRVGNQYNLLDACSHNLVDDILNHRLINDWQHLFRNRLGGRQHMHPQSGYRNNCFQTCHSHIHPYSDKSSIPA
jgi:hypothetical protein